MPVLEPSTNQEMKDWVDLAFRLSRESELYIGFLVTTNQADGGGSVAGRAQSFSPGQHAQSRFSSTRPRSISKRTSCCRRAPGVASRDFPRRYERLWASARRHGVNRITPGTLARARRRIGFVSSALAYSYLEHALQQLGLTDTFPAAQARHHLSARSRR